VLKSLKRLDYCGRIEAAGFNAKDLKDAALAKRAL